VASKLKPRTNTTQIKSPPDKYRAHSKEINSIETSYSERQEETHENLKTNNYTTHVIQQRTSDDKIPPTKGDKIT
jgi:hypothetical protein